MFEPITTTQNETGVAIDFGQNSAAIPVVRLRGLAGSTVRVRTGEWTTAGEWNQTWFDYTLCGGGEEEFRPRFTSWGHRSILVEGAVLASDESAEKPVVLGAKALSVRCSAPLAGSFETSKVKAAFNAEFLDVTTGQYANGTQCAQGMPSVLGLVPSDQRDEVFELLVADGKAKNKLTAGDIGNRYAIVAFAEANAHELLYEISTATYGYQALRPDRGALAQGRQWIPSRFEHSAEQHRDSSLARSDHC